MEIYQWLLRQNGYNVSDEGYFVYCNGITDVEKFDAKLEFKITLIKYRGEDSWIEKTLEDIKKLLEKNNIPEENLDCDFCAYRNAVNDLIN